MKQGLSLTQLATEIERQSKTKHDYIADTRSLELRPPHGEQAPLLKNISLVLRNGSEQYFGVTPHARKQLADKLGIPLAYFQRLECDHPDLLAQNVNTLFQREPSRHMVRTLDGDVRGILSDRYRPLDNYDLADAVLPLLMEAKVAIESCQVTETKLYIKFTCPWLERELPVPPGLKMGEGHNFFVRRILGAGSITNSEVGAGMIGIAPGIFERQCTNLAVFKDEGFGRIHIGKKIEGDDPVMAYLTDETKRLDDAVVWSKVRDVVKAVLDGKALEAIVEKLNAARGEPIVGNPMKVVEVASRKLGLSEDERGGLLRHLVNSGEMSRYGMQWAVTRLASDVDDYDRASELERMGGAVIELPANDWRAIAEAA